MALTRLAIQHVRNIESTQLDLSPRLNLVTGKNASGKTSLLEALSLISQGRSFRTPRIDQLVQHQAHTLLLQARAQDQGQTRQIGLLRENKTTQVKVNGQRIARSSDLLSQTPVFVLTPESHELLNTGPRLRRQYLDWGVFHVEHRYLDCWQKYHRILRQRNACLRRKSHVAEIQAWDESLAKEALLLDHYRTTYLSTLNPFLHEYAETLIGEKVDFAYRPGWKQEESGLREQLESALETDRERGFTRPGPHRADLRMLSHGQAVQTVFSRGQQKLLICAMTLAQQAVMSRESLILIDDLPAELDSERRRSLLQLLAKIPGQIFITATEPDLILACLNPQDWPERKMFHVERGQFKEVIY